MLRRNKNILLLIRMPNLDMIPSLKSLIIFLSQHGFYITIISAYNDRIPQFSYTSNNILLIQAKERTNKIGIPTNLKLLSLFILKYLKLRPRYVIGGDSSANYLLSILSGLFSIPFINFLLEYPNLDSSKDRASLEKARYIITHDKWHREFLMQHFGIKFEKFLLLPNASFTPQYYKNSYYLYGELNIGRDRKIILHSGGLGPYFMCKELVDIANSWPSKYCLVFHTSYNATKTEYFNFLKTRIQDKDKVRFSTNPVPNNILDELIASAYIGIALYSIEILSYRAIYMGLAAGKIGNYLKCGIPVVATNVVSLSYIKDYQCGVLINNLEDIHDAIKTISNNYSMYSQNARKCYHELWEPKNYLQVILNTLIEHN